MCAAPFQKQKQKQKQIARKMEASVFFNRSERFSLSIYLCKIYPSLCVE